MAVLGSVNIDGLNLDSGMQADLAGGMSVAAFNSKYAGGGFQPIATSRQVGAAGAAAAPAAAAGPTQEQGWNNQLSDFAKQQQTEWDAMLARQNSQQDGLFGQYQTAINSQEKLPDLYQRLQKEAGLPEATAQLQIYKDQIYRTKDMLDRLDGDVTSRTQGTLTSEAMRRRILESEGADLNNQLGRLGTAMAPVTDLVTGAQSQVAAMMPLYMQQQDKELSPLTMQINSLSDRYAREITGFTQNKQTQLDVLMDQVQRGRELADHDRDLAESLAAEERQYQRQRSLAASAASSYLGGSGGSGGSAGVSTRALPGGTGYVGNNDLRGRLAYLAQQGDQSAAIALKYVGNDGKYNIAAPNLTPQILSAMNAYGFTNAYSNAGSNSYQAPSGASVLKLISK